MRWIERFYGAGQSLAAALVLLISAGCSVVNAGSTAAGQGQRAAIGVQRMLEEIYASGKPEGFEKIDVSAAVAQHFPVGSHKDAVENAFNPVPSSKVVEDSTQALVIRDTRGTAMFDVDPRSVLMTFRFNSAGSLVEVSAVHMKRQ